MKDDDVNYESSPDEEVPKDDLNEDTSELDPALTRYLKEIGKVPLLSRQEETKLAEKVQRGDEGALKRLVEANLRFVVSVAKKYRNLGLTLSDLISEGNIGLIEAAKRYKPDKGVKFISYAIWWIRQAILQAIADQGNMMRLPIKQAGMLYKLTEKYQQLSQSLGREPTDAELAEALDISQADVEILRRSTRPWLPLEPISEDEDQTKYMDLIQNESATMAEAQLLMGTLKRDIERLLDELDEREREIIKMHFGLEGYEPMTLEDIGKEFNLTRERIRQIELKAKAKLRKIAMQRHLKDYLN